jgi:hypothetical protein
MATKYLPVSEVTVPTEIPKPFVELLDTLVVDGWNVGAFVKATVLKKTHGYYGQAFQLIDKVAFKALHTDHDYKMNDKLWCISKWLEAYAIIHANVDYAIDNKVLASAIEYQTAVLTQTQEKFNDPKPISLTIKF